MIRHSHTTDSAQQHRDWLSLIEVNGPFLSLPVLRATWPNLDALDKPTRDRLRLEHTTWQSDTRAEQRAWIEFVLGELLGWDDALRWNEDGALDAFTLDVAEHDSRISPAFALVRPGEDAKPTSTEVLGLVCEPITQPTARIKGEAWTATPVDRLAQLCRHHEVQLGLATDGRWWALVSAPRGKVTTTAVFDTVAWNEAAERDVVRAFVSLLGRIRFYGVPDDEKLVELLRRSEDSQEDITEALGIQVRQAVELLVAAIGRADTAQLERDERRIDVDAHEVYRAAVTIMMRIVFLLFAEERKLLPSDNKLYARTYSAGRLCAQLEQQALEGSEDELENSHVAWHRLRALFDAVYRGIEHPRLRMHAHDGSLFNPNEFGWLPPNIDDRTVFNMLRALQYVEIGTGRSKERRKLSFRELDVEQIGYVYEGLLSFDSYRADTVTIGLVGKQGLEAEVPLRELERIATGCADVTALAATIAEEFKASGVGSTRVLGRKLAALAGTEKEEARRKLLAVTRGDNALTERLLPFFGIIRLDRRDQPIVIMPGELFVTESPLRKNTGTHYTPRFLAEQVVEGALEPLVYEPGPLLTANRDDWRLKSSADLLALKIADIAMGSAAFLVAAARYLGARLIEAWIREGADQIRAYRASDPGVDAEGDPVVIEARRQIIEHCLYGVDINPMAVEMAKLSLWLVSMDPHRPFTFLDDRLLVGDSLLGITSLEQLEYMHMDPKKGRQIHSEGTLIDLTAGVRELVDNIADDRRSLATIDGSTLEGLERKRSVLADVERKTTRARLFANLCVGAALAGAKRADNGLRDASLSAADYARRVDTAMMEARSKVHEWLETDWRYEGFRREPVHWPLVFPEVFEDGGFDAIVGNPPFLGGTKISEPLGTAYREYLAEVIANSVRGGGRCDLVAYFALQAHLLTNNTGQTGMIATNTLAQGDTREVGLDQLIANGATIRQSVKSAPWPSKSASLEYCAVWTSRLPLGKFAERRANGAIVPGITTSLDPVSRASGVPKRLLRRKIPVSQGSKLDGVGFIMEPSEAQELIGKDERNAEVIFPYLNGQDVNSSPTCSASRWVINYFDWTEDQAKTYPDCYERVTRLVKPERARHGEKNAREFWWRYQRSRPELYRAISDLDRVVVITLVSKTVMPVMVHTGQVFAHKLGVFITADTALLALLSSAPHYWWTVRRSSTMKTDINYSPSDVFETFALPTFTHELRQLGDRLDIFRLDVMRSRNCGLTKTYHRVFDPGCADADIEALRHIHRAIDEATIRAYGWEDRIATVGGLDHGFHKIGRETRYTIGPDAQREILDSLLELNQERYAEEVAQGLHHRDSSRRAKPIADEGTLF